MQPLEEAPGSPARVATGAELSPVLEWGDSGQRGLAVATVLPLTQPPFLFLAETQPCLGVRRGVGSFSQGAMCQLVPKGAIASAGVAPARDGAEGVEVGIPVQPQEVGGTGSGGYSRLERALGRTPRTQLMGDHPHPRLEQHDGKLRSVCVSQSKRVFGQRLLP